MTNYQTITLKPNETFAFNAVQNYIHYELAAASQMKVNHYRGYCEIKFVGTEKELKKVKRIVSRFMEEEA